MAFSEKQWIARANEKLGQIGFWLDQRREEQIPYLAYSTISGLALWPLVEEAADSSEILPVIGIMYGVIQGQGANQIAKKLQQWQESPQVPTEAMVMAWVDQQLPNADWREAVDTILLQLEAIPSALSALEYTQRAQFVAQLRQEMTALGNLDRFEAQFRDPGTRELDTEAEDSSSRPPEHTVISSQVSVGGDAVEGDKVGGDKIDTDKYIAQQIIVLTTNTAEDFWRQFRKPHPDVQRATARYLAHLVNRYQYLDFKGMGFTDRVALRLPLAEMYVPLRALYEVPKGDTWARQFHLAGRQIGPDEIEGMGDRLSERQSLIDLLSEKDGLIVLGDPGAGKTTFLKYLAVRIALGEGEQLGLDNRLPVLLPLSAYANALQKEEIPLHRFFSSYYRSLGIDESLEEMLEQALRQGRTLLLLDGLDEVANEGQRGYVLERVLHFFAAQQQDGNKVVLTSRVVGYRKVRGAITDMQECTLVDFDDEEIELFVTKWTGAIERAARGDTEVATWEAEREREDLLKSVRHNPGVRRLAANPLLLTILALMKRQGIVLPERRVELYEKYVETLLKNWNLARGLGRPPTRDLDVVETTRVLAPLALWMHETSPGIGLVKREEVRQKLVEIYTQRQIENPQQAAQQLLEDARDYASLLLERGPGEYGFIHLTFQEYLAAVGIAQRGQTDIQPVVDKLAEYVGDSKWHEVLLLTIGYLGIIQQRDEPAGKVLQQLIDAGPGEPGQSAVLAGEAVVDAWPGGVTAACRNSVIDTMLSTMRDSTGVAARLRVQSAQLLSDLGDPRSEVTTVDTMQFCLVPRGPFLMGSDDVPSSENELLQTIYESQKPLHEVNIHHDYWLARYPVTNAQYKQFVAAGGYEDDAYWAEAREAGIRQDGEVTAYTWIVEKSKFEQMTRRGPHDYGRPFSLANHPVVGLTWYEALAFCRWLTDKWRRSDLLPDGWAIQLPSEAEWEKAARGGLQYVAEPLVRPLSSDLTNRPQLIENPKPQRLYPWGNDEAIGELANGRETDINASSGVGAFTTGASPYGCEEMSGNVFEWTRSLWGKGSEPTFKYPYKITDDRENLEKEKNWPRILRGGSWNAEDSWLRCAFRFGHYPDLRINYYGFRVCASPISIPHSDR